MASQRESFQRAYRIVSNNFPPFDGAGAHRWGSRWVNGGRWVVHAAETYSLAILENLVHWQTSRLPPTLVCVEITIPDDVSQARIAHEDVPGWQDDDYIASRAVGDAWYDRSQSAVLWVPSVVSPFESNVLLNQRHPDIARIIVGAAVPAHLGSRLTRR